MIEEIQILLDNYTEWLGDKTVLRQINDWVEITTPYLDRHNDYIQIYAQRNNGGFLLTDDGWTISDLESSGCKIQSGKRQDHLKMVLNGFGVAENNGALQVFTYKDNFALRKHNLLQAILTVNDMFYLSEAVIKPLFLEDVTNWLDENSIRYIPRVKFSGKSGYDHLFDFVIPKSRTMPERIIRAINRPGKESAQAFVFAWLDTREVRPPDSQAYAIINDSDGSIPASVTDALVSYEVAVVLWSLRMGKLAGLAE
ncbi:MAG: DUF1829 domain-containing protein [Calditrichaeota bacterium]|nr:DUF1829 domain-containing protein [Calditrichota bacterium]